MERDWKRRQNLKDTRVRESTKSVPVSSYVILFHRLLYGNYYCITLLLFRKQNLQKREIPNDNKIVLSREHFYKH